MAKSSATLQQDQANILDAVQNVAPIVDKETALQVQRRIAAGTLPNSPMVGLTRKELFLQTAMTVAITNIVNSSMSPIGCMGKKAKRDSAKAVFKDAIVWVEVLEEAYDELYPNSVEE